MQAKSIIDATASLRMRIMETPDTFSPEQMVMKVNERNNISPKITLDQQVLDNEALNASSEVLKAGTGNFLSGLEAGPTQGAEVTMSTPDGLYSVQGSSSPPEGYLMQVGFMGFMIRFLFTPESGSF